jgi:hypothetical protein
MTGTKQAMHPHILFGQKKKGLLFQRKRFLAQILIADCFIQPIIG